MDKTVTNAVMGSVATSAATGIAKKAVTTGAAIVKSTGGVISGEGNIVAVGTYAQTPTQLVNANILKPGADTLINGLAQRAGATIESIMPTQLFTGKSGAVDLKSFISDTASQTTAVITTMQKAQNTLGKIGALTGKEASTQTAGIVAAAATVGLTSTINAVKSISGVATSAVNNIPGSLSATVSGALGSATSGITSEVNKVTGQITNVAGQLTGTLGQATNAIAAIGAGAAAAGLANKLGGLGGISNSIKGLSKGLGGLKGLGGKLGGLFGGGGGDGPSFTDLVESVKGPAGAAFTSIRDSLKPLQAGVPQNLTAIAKASAATIAGISSSASGIAGVGDQLLKSFVDQNSITSITDLNELIDNNTVAGITGSFRQIKAQLGSVGDSLSSQSADLINQFGALSTNTGGINIDLLSQFGGNAVSTVTSLSKALTNTPNLINGIPDNLGSIVNPMNTLNNIFNDINTDVTGIRSTSPLVPSNIENTITDINNAVKDISGIAGAASAIAKGDMTELSNAANAIQSGASAAMSSALASGINNLPGGARAISAVMNNAEGAINSLPGTEMLGDLVKNLQTSAINEVSKTVDGITNSINSKLGGVLGKEGGLTNLISSALPLGKAAGLLSGLSALGAGGPAKVKLPTISFNTFDRLGVDSQVKTLLSNPKIPIPNLVGEIKAGVVNQVEQLIKKNKDAFKIFDELENWDQKIKEATDKLFEAESNFPAGDRGIASAQGILDSILNDSELVSLRKKAESFGENAVDDVRSLMSSASQTATNMLNSANLGSAVSTIKASAMEVMQQTNNNPTKNTVKSIAGQGSTAITQLQARSSSSQTDINNSIAGIIGPSDNTTFI
jgi:hypothetical protein